MLVSFKFSNYRSYSKKYPCELNLVRKYREKDKDFLYHDEKITLSRIIPIYGANASGKTTILRAFSDLMYHIKSLPEETVMETFSELYIPFFDDKNKNIDFEVTFYNSDEKNFYRYKLSVEEKGIVSEELLTGTEINNIEEVIFNRDQKKDIIKVGKGYDEIEAISSKFFPTLANKSHISLIGLLFRMNPSKILGIKKVFNNYSVQFSDNRYDLKTFLGKRIEEHIKEQNGYKSSIINWLKMTDEYIEDVKIEDERTFFHYKERKKNLPYRYLSEGTKKMFLLSSSIERVIQENMLFIVDELERHFHPAISAKVIKTLLEKSETSQIMFSSHNPLIIDGVKLPHHFIYFVKKDQKQYSHLDDFNYVMKEIGMEIKDEDSFSTLFHKINNSLVDSVLPWTYKNYLKK